MHIEPELWSFLTLASVYVLIYVPTIYTNTYLKLFPLGPKSGIPIYNSAQ